MVTSALPREKDIEPLLRVEGHTGPLGIE